MEEDGRFEIPTLKKTTRIMREVEEEDEIIKLKKIPVAPPKETEEEEKPQKVSKTTVFDFEEMVHKEETIEMSLVTRRHVEERKPLEKDVVKKLEVIKPEEKEQTEVPKDAWTHQKPIPKDEDPVSAFAFPTPF